MGLLSLEQGRASVRADFAFYGFVVLLLTAATLTTTPRSQALAAATSLAVGFTVWTLAEYLLHRFVLHGLPPFSAWHGRHHERPRAFIATPTLLTAALFGAFVFAPMVWLVPGWRGLAATLGVMLGYLAYIGTHHAVHQGLGASPALRRQRRWHALHHRRGERACYGVSVRLWDHVFRTARAGAPR